MPLFSVYHHDNEADLFSMECTTGVLNTALVQLVQPAASGPRMTPTPTPASATNDNVIPPTTNGGSNHTINATEASTTALLSSYPLAATAIRPSAPCGYQRMELLPLSFVTDLLSSSKVVAALQTCAAAALSTPPLGAANATLSPGGTSGRNSFGNRSSSVTNGANANNGTATSGGSTNNNNTSMTTIGANSSSAVMATLQSVLHNIPFVGLLLAPVQLSVAELSGLVVNGTYILLGCREASPHATQVHPTQDDNNASIPLPLMSHGGLAVLETAHAAQGTAIQDGSGPVVGMNNDGGEEENNKAGKRAKNGTTLPNTDNEALNLSTRNVLPTTTPLPPRKLSELLSEARTIGAMLSPETAGYTTTTTTSNSRTSPHTNNTSNSNMTCSYTCLSTGPGPAMMAAAAMVCSNTGGGSAPNSAAGANSARSNNNNNNSSSNSHGHGGAGGAGGHEDAFSYGPARLVTQPLPQPISTPHATITTPHGQSEGATQEGGAVQNETTTAGKETRTDGSPARTTDAEVTAHGTGAGRAGKSGNASGGSGGRRNNTNNAGGASSEKSTPRTGQDNTNTSSNRERSPSSGAANTNPIGGSGTHALRSVGLTGLAEEGDFGPVPLSQAASALLSMPSSSAPTGSMTGPGAPPLIVNMNTAAVTGRFPSGGLGQNGLDGPLLHSLQQPHLIERMISLDVLWRGPRGEHDLLQALLNEYVKMMKGKVEAVRMQWMTTYNNARTATAGAVEGRKKRGKK